MTNDVKGREAMPGCAGYRRRCCGRSAARDTAALRAGDMMPDPHFQKFPLDMQPFGCIL